MAGKTKAAKETAKAAVAGDERAESGRTKPEKQQQQLHAPGGQSTELGFYTNTRSLEQRGHIGTSHQASPGAASNLLHHGTTEKHCCA